MAKGTSEEVSAAHRSAERGVDFEALSDEQLLQRFLRQGGEGADLAFRTLVVRHGPMVLGVCRNVLREAHDAEDAFQATFLVLARKGKTIRDGRVVGRWLYEVAYRIAVRARSLAARRRAQERQTAKMSSVTHEFDREMNDLLPLIHEEINRLPENYRTPVALCYLEGKTHEEAAALLEWPLGTVKGRLSRAREVLRSRLSRRGVTLTAALIGVFLSEKRLLAADLPATLVDSTVRTAMKDLAGQAAEMSRAGIASKSEFTSFKSWPSLYRVLLVLAVLSAVGYGFTNLTAYASSMPPEQRPRIATYLIDFFAIGGNHGTACH